MNIFDQWNRLKKEAHIRNKIPYFKERDIFYAKVGCNIGYEQSGKGERFKRPILIYRKFNNRIFWGIPLSKTKKRNKYLHLFSFIKNVDSIAILSQIRLFDAKRLEHKIGMISDDDYLEITKKIAGFVAGNLLAPTNAGAIPKEFVSEVYKSNNIQSNRHITLMAHNIRSLWNVGSLFRSSDCFGVEKIYLTGYTATPPRREISKTAIGAEEWIPWEQVDDPKEVIEQKKKDGYRVVALELTDDAVDISNYDPPEKICLILGHEVTGVSEDLLKLADDKVKIPMFGKKESLNVSVATGIALNHLRKS